MAGLFLVSSSHSIGQTPNAQSTEQSSVPQKAVQENLSASPSLKVSSDELYALQKLQIEKQLQESVLDWAKTRFWIIAIASVLVGFFGIRALVREFVSGELKEAMRASAEAQAAAQSARESIREVRAEAGKYKDLVDSASITADDVNRRLQEVKSRVDAEGARSVAAAGIQIGAVREQVEELQKTVSALAADSERNRKILSEAQSRIAQTHEAARVLATEFSSNAQINVDVVPFENKESEELASAITSALTTEGFKVSQSTWDNSQAYRMKSIRIAYQPVVDNKINFITDTIRRTLGQRGIKPSYRLERKELPISNRPDYHVAIFFERKVSV